VASAEATQIAALAEFYAGDARIVLVPIEHLGPDGVTPAFAAFLGETCGWASARVDFFNRAFATYWSRSAELADRCRDWPSPRLRNVAIAGRTDDVPLYAQILNTSTWTLFAADFDPATSDVEFAAYLLAHGDRMTVTGEVTEAALRNAAWWLTRSDTEVAAFAAAAQRSSRPDAEAYRRLATAVSWLRSAAHRSLRPPLLVQRYGALPGCDVLIPPSDVPAANALVQDWGTVARRVVADFTARWRTPNRDALATLSDWLASEAPRVVLCSRRRRSVWDSSEPSRVGALRAELRHVGGEIISSIHADLRVIAARSRAFHDALVYPDALAPVAAEMEQGGYVYMSRDQGGIAYDLHEPGIERLAMPAIPFARAMLAARTVHEWAHRAVDSGWVGFAVAPAEFARRKAACADRLDEVIGGRDGASGTNLIQKILPRFDDFRANLLAQRFLNRVERETYARHNLRTLRGSYDAAGRWPMFVRYLYEVQYLRFTGVADRLAFLRHSTWFEQDFVVSGHVQLDALAELDASFGELAACWAVDESRFRAADGLSNATDAAKAFDP